MSRTEYILEDDFAREIEQAICFIDADYRQIFVRTLKERYLNAKKDSFLGQNLDGVLEIVMKYCSEGDLNNFCSQVVFLGQHDCSKKNEKEILRRGISVFETLIALYKNAKDAIIEKQDELKKDDKYRELKELLQHAHYNEKIKSIIEVEINNYEKQIRENEEKLKLLKGDFGYACAGIKDPDKVYYPDISSFFREKYPQVKNRFKELNDELIK